MQGEVVMRNYEKYITTERQCSIDHKLEKTYGMYSLGK